MNNIKRKLIYIGLIITMVLTTTACSKKQGQDDTKAVKETTNKNVNQGADTQNKDKEVSAPVDEDAFKQLVVSVGKKDVYYSEAIVYFKYIESKYEAYFGNQIWNYKFGDRTFGDMAKQEIMDMIVQTKIVSSYADKYKVTLTEEEELQVEENAANFLSGLTEEDKALYGLTDEVAQAFYRDNKLYENVYNAATMDVDTEVPDKEAKQITIQQILVSTTETSGNDTVTPMSEKMKEKEYAKAKRLLKEAKKTEDFYAFAESHTESDKVEYTFGKGEMPEALEKVAFSLQTGELSRIVETEEGYHILYCVTAYDEDATLEKKEDIIAERQDKFFQDLYKKWAAEDKIDINDKVWNTMNFAEKPSTDSTVEE